MTTNGSGSTSIPTENGELWWAGLRKRRPVVVVGRDDLRGRRSRATVARVTTTVRGLASEVPLDASDGLARPCVVNCEELTTIDKVRLIQRIGHLSESKRNELREALAFALQLD